MALVNCQEARSMKLLNPFLIFIQFFFIILIFRSEVGAVDTPSCTTLLHPLESKVEEIKDRGGIYGIFDQSHFKVNHT